MKRSDFKKQSAVFYIGKGIVVASLVATASIGFTLGFFVGKYAQRGHTPPTDLSSTTATGQPSAIATEQASTAENIGTTGQPVPAAPDQMGQSDVDGKYQALHYDSKSISSEMKEKNLPLSPPKVTEPSASEKVTRHLTKETVRSRESTNTTKEPSARRYTVQVGAFKNTEEAEALKSRLNGKGYRAFVVESRTKNHGLLHKVMVGTYPTRKEAEVVSIKIRNAEGLRAFVTFAALEGVSRQR